MRCKARLSARFLVIAALAVAMGCPSSTQTPPGDSADNSTGKPTIDEQAAAPELPVAEFRHPPLTPESEPLPRLVEEQATPLREPLAPLPPDEPIATPDVDAEQAKAASTSPPRPAGKKADGAFDPIKENGPIFVGWPQPKLAIVITGMEDGYIEPCGCAGLDRMRGGMSRRHTFIERLRKQGWPLIVLDAGGIARGFGRQAEMKFQTLVEGKRKMGYDAIAFGANELRLPAGELVSVAAGIDGESSLFLSANVGLFGFDAGITPASRVIKAGEMKVGVTAVLGTQHQKEINNDEIELKDPVEALRSVVPDLKQKADYLVLLAHATKEESIELARLFPEFDVVVTSDGPPTPPARPATIEGTDSLLINVGHKGMEAIVLGLYDGHPPRYQRVPLDSRFPASKDMQMLMAAYQDQLKIIGFAGLGLRPVPHPQMEVNGGFVGSKKCQSCHEQSYDVWIRSGHGRAYKTLADLDPPRNFDPECVSCHVIGWHPTNYFPYKGGFESVEKTPHLINTGCEACHGPGERHVQAELGSDETLQEKYRKAMVITKEESKKRQCAACHDLDNSPDFDFDAYWPLVEHYEDEEEE